MKGDLNFPVIIILMWDHLPERSCDLIAQLDVILVDKLECVEQNKQIFKLYCSKFNMTFDVEHSPVL